MVSPGDVLCKCGVAAKEEVVKKEGKNQGKKFYHCSKGKAENCKFWKWENQLKPENFVPQDNQKATEEKVQESDTEVINATTTGQDDDGGASFDNEPNRQAVNCRCNIPAKRDVVKKDGPNLGKAFLHCSQPKADNCKFWAWEENKEEGGPATGQPTVTCQCGIAAKREVVKKEGKNQGKVFYHCSKKKGDNCKFWQWADKEAEEGDGQGKDRKRGQEEGEKTEVKKSKTDC